MSFYVQISNILKNKVIIFFHHCPFLTSYNVKPSLFWVNPNPLTLFSLTLYFVSYQVLSMRFFSNVLQSSFPFLRLTAKLKYACSHGWPVIIDTKHDDSLNGWSYVHVWTVNYMPTISLKSVKSCMKVCMKRSICFGCHMFQPSCLSGAIELKQVRFTGDVFTTIWTYRKL